MMMVPEGGMSHPQFFYEDTPDLFFARTGWGPLIVCLDTNLLIHLAQNLDEIGGSFGFDGHGFAPELWGDPVRALHDLFILWFWRDVRFFLTPEQMHDGRLNTERAHRRESILDAFAQDFWQRGGFDRASHVAGERVKLGIDLDIPLKWPPSLAAVLPPSMDGMLVGAALSAGAHVFLSTDQRHVLSRATDLRRFSIAVMSPGELLHALETSGELERVPSGDPLLPDLQSLAHFYAVAPEDDGD